MLFFPILNETAMIKNPSVLLAFLLEEGLINKMIANNNPKISPIKAINEEGENNIPQL